jgi:hypothetical protein
LLAHQPLNWNRDPLHIARAAIEAASANTMLQLWL